MLIKVDESDQLTDWLTDWQTDWLTDFLESLKLPEYAMVGAALALVFSFHTDF